MPEIEPDLTGELARAAEAATSGITARIADVDSEIDDPTLDAEPDVDGASDDDDAVDDPTEAVLISADV
jgi:hypothetical protein